MVRALETVVWYDVDVDEARSGRRREEAYRVGEYGYPPPAGLTEDLSQTQMPQIGGYGRTEDEIAQRILVGMQQGIDAQIDWRLRGGRPDRSKISGEELGLILGSLGLGVTLTALAGAFAGLPAITVIWIGLVLINLAWAVRRGA